MTKTQGGSWTNITFDSVEEANSCSCFTADGRPCAFLFDICGGRLTCLRMNYPNSDMGFRAIKEFDLPKDQQGGGPGCVWEKELS